ncbi:type II secretion system protein GspG [Hyalangium gracile]|uniref:type II secretion system protein GspG n=1 Tax=Hyalangium gracile TaxID=394092 RepID=UPI001CCABB11|nr:type II secretion system protein GspG [Hyalangium gracile]
MSEQPPVQKRPSPLRLFLGIAVVVCVAVTTATLAFRRPEDPSWPRVHADLTALNEALQKYHAKHGRYPDEHGTLQVLVPEFLPAVPVDPWGRPYVYENNGRKPLLITFGQDGERGGMGVEQDHNQDDGHVR